MAIQMYQTGRGQFGTNLMGVLQHPPRDCARRYVMQEHRSNTDSLSSGGIYVQAAWPTYESHIAHFHTSSANTRELLGGHPSVDVDHTTSDTLHKMIWMPM